MVASSGGTVLDSESGYDKSPAHIDPETLAMTPDGIRIRPEHIQQSLREHHGIAQHPLAYRFCLKPSLDEYL